MQSVAAKGKNTQGAVVWLLRIDEATYLLIEGLGPQEANLYCDESEAMKAFRRTTAITSCPLSPFRSHTFSPEWKHGERTKNTIS